MRLGLVVAKLIAANTRFGSVIGGAADLSLAWDSTLQSDMAFVIPLSDAASPNTGDVVIKQKLTERFGVVVALATDTSDRDKTGFTAYDLIDSVRSELWGALLGWTIPGMEDITSYAGGRITRIDRAYIWYQFDFECGRWVGKDDGVVEDSSDMLDTVFAQYQLEDT